MDKAGRFVNRPPLLDGSNYDYWKSCMISFLKSIDSKTWKGVLKGWEHHVALDKDGNKTTVLKSKQEWTTTEDESLLTNSRALNTIFDRVDKNMFRMIKQCIVAKVAWEILKTTHEGTSKLKSSRLQLLTTKFENLKMMEDENIQDYYMNILDIANSFDSLGEKYSDENLIRKIFRSLPKRFDMKVTAIEEAQDISNMKVDELIGSLQAFELANGYKKKNIVFIFNTNEEDVQCEMEIDEIILDAITRLGREFNKVLEMIDKKSRPNVQNISFNISINNESQRRDRNNDEYSNRVTALTGRCTSDKDVPETDDKRESTKQVCAMTGRVFSNTESSDEELAYDELAASYKGLYTRSAEVSKILVEQKKINSQLLAERSNHLAKIFELNDEVTLLNSQLEHVKNK